MRPPETHRPLALPRLLLTLVLLALPAAAEGGLTRVRIDGPLDVGTLALVKRAIDHARANDDQLLVELDTPGGEVELMWKIARAIDAAPEHGVRTVAWVNDRALSAGSLLALACERLYMRSHATIGSALPVSVGPGGLVPSSPDAQVREKLSSHLRGEFRGIAAKHQRSPVLAEAMVDPEVRVLQVRIEGESRLISGQEWDDIRQRGTDGQLLRTVVDEGRLFNATGSEATQLGLADGMAESLEEVAEKVGAGGARVSTLEPSASEELAGLLYMLSPVLLILCIVFAYLEFKAPGFGVPGVLALICLGVLLFGRYLVGLADVPHVVLIVTGVLLLAVELFVVPGTVWAGLAGGLAILAGLVWSFAAGSGALEYDLGRRILVDEAFRVVAAALVAVLASWGLSRLLPRTPIVGRLVLAGGALPAAGSKPDAGGRASELARVGARGHALTPLRPVGKVVLDANPLHEYEALSDGMEIAAGAPIRVVERRRSGRLLVAPAGDDGVG